MKNGFEGDLTKTFEEFAKLTSEQMTNAFARGLRKAGKEVVNLTKASAKSSMLKRDNPHFYRGERISYIDEIEDAARIKSVWKGYEGAGKASEISVSVSVFGSTDKNSGTYRFRFLEKGTRQRFARHYTKGNAKYKLLKKPKNLGRITPRWWFRNAYQSVVPSVDSILLTEIDKTIDRLNANG